MAADCKQDNQSRKIIFSLQPVEDCYTFEKNSHFTLLRKWIKIIIYECKYLKKDYDELFSQLDELCFLVIKEKDFVDDFMKLPEKRSVTELWIS